ncbi:MAG: nitrile hydratase subunit beta [Boseongicola sp.]|nr:nitrile hydratase subunit beta [Boseongicola sp.]
MDSVHDLGGKQGFGPIDVNEPDEPFHAEWEGRAWGITCSTRAPNVPIDWWLFVRENSVPTDYLSRPYFDSWIETDMITMIEAGVCTIDELATGKSATEPLASAKPMTTEECVNLTKSAFRRFDVEVSSSPTFSVGDAVVANLTATSGHTRLPAYVRGKPGIIHSHHGAHFFPDDCAKGKERAEHLYTVAFASKDLWPEASESPDMVYLDLWESYLGER